MVCVLRLQSDVCFASDEATKSAEKGEKWGGKGVPAEPGGTGNARPSISVTASQGSFSPGTALTSKKWAPWGLHCF